MDEDYYKPIKVSGAFNDNYIKYESRGHKNKTLSLKEYLQTIIPYLHDLINDHKTTMKLHDKAIGEWKIQLAIQTNFISSKDSGETRIVHTWSDNIEIIMGSKTNDIINRLIDSLLQ